MDSFRSNDNATRSVAASTFEKALAQALDKEVKAFLIRQLRTIATDDNVDVLSTFLMDEYLSPCSTGIGFYRNPKANEGC
jgi:hypothetical protein